MAAALGSRWCRLVAGGRCDGHLWGPALGDHSAGCADRRAGDGIGGMADCQRIQPGGVQIRARGRTDQEAPGDERMRRSEMNRSTSTSRLATVLGLAVGATGCAILWVAGAVPFPVPPGMVIMAAGALFVGWVPWRWAPAGNTLLGLLFAGGVLI